MPLPAFGSGEQTGEAMTIKEIFETMAYGPAPEAAGDALAWIAERGGAFGQYIDGAFTKARADFSSVNPATGKPLADLSQATAAEIRDAVAAARAAQPGWEAMGGPARARLMYALARGLQKHARLFAVLETLDGGKPIRESRDIDIPLAQRHFYYHAGMAQLMESALPDRRAIGVCGQIVPWNFPLLMLAWKIAPALAMGNTVVLKPAEWTSLTALRFAELCVDIGLPPGVVNIVTGDGTAGAQLVAQDVDKIAFTGSTEVGRQIRRATAGRGIGLTLELGGKSPFIVFDDADLDSAVEGVVDSIWFNQGQVCCAGSRLLVHAPVAQTFEAKLRARMKTLRVGDPLDKAVDMGPLVSRAHLDRVCSRVAAAPQGAVYQAGTALPLGGCYFPPTLISGLDQADPLMHTEIFGPVLVSTTFRTADEAVALANDTRYGLAASVWTETATRGLDVARRVAAGVVWVNCTNTFDAAAPFGGVRESGFGREGGWDGLRAYTKPRADAPVSPAIAPFVRGGGSRAAPDSIDRTGKLYVAGKHTRPDSGYSRPVWGRDGALLGEIGLASRKDLRNAVEAARAAAGWGKMSAHGRAQVLYYIAENLSLRAAEFADRLDALTGTSAGAAEVDIALDRLFTFAAWADKFDGRVLEAPFPGLVLESRAPVGVIGALAPDAQPLAGLVALMAPALAMGNRVVLVASQPFPLAAIDLVQVLETSDVPAGVVNVRTGDHAELAPHLARHPGVDGVWSFSSVPGLAAVIEEGAADTLNRTWTACGLPQASDRAFLDAATETRTIWLPAGE